MYRTNIKLRYHYLGFIILSRIYHKLTSRHNVRSSTDIDLFQIHLQVTEKSFCQGYKNFVMLHEF